MTSYGRITSETLGMSLTLGESMDTGNGRNILSPTRRGILAVAENPQVVVKPKLPPAVANVPSEHIRSYLHTKKVNHYLVGQKLGEGSFAKVKEAFHVLVGEKVAMKVIDKKKAQQDPYVAKNFRREAKLLQMVRHPNILQLLEVIETDSSFYLITELCSGGELMKYIYKKGHLDENETRKYMRHIVSAVDHLHRAGIIHRDLKVENLMLDANMDIKLIDFGLSNEEYIQGDNGLVHCNTQCGSPAYAAPELLGHKAYGPQVDIWSIGVNMYAMLTGCLPYTVEPFNITALHAKMLENKMNPIPEHLSKNCKDMLRNLLRSNPDERLKMSEIMMHPWMNESHALPFGPAPYPNRLELLDLNNDIIQHMVYILKLKQTEEELTQELISNRATNSAAIYHLLVARLRRFNRQFRNSSSTRARHSRVSRDQGFFEDEDEDAKSIVSLPTTTTRRPRPRRIAGDSGKRRREQPAQPMTNATLMEVEEGDQVTDSKEESLDVPNGFNPHRRRSTMPEMMLEQDIEALKKKMHQREENAARAARHAMGPAPVQRPPEQRPEAIPIHRRGDQESSRHRPINSSRRKSPSNPQQLVPIQQQPSGSRLKRNHYSTPSGLNEVREQLRTHLPHQAPVREAWRSNPGSQAGSRQPSRHSSRQPSGVNRTSNNSSITSMHQRATSFDDQAGNKDAEEELTFHQVSSNTLPRSYRYRSRTISGTSNDSTLPSIKDSQTAHLGDKHTSSPSRSRAMSDAFRNGYTSSGVTDSKPAELVDALNKIERAAYNLKIRDIERSGYNNIICTWNGIKIQVFVNRDQDGYKVSYSWLSGGNVKSFEEKRDKLAKRIRL